MQDLLSKDLQYNWHPCSQMKDLAEHPPVLVTSAKGSYIELSDGSRLIDAISSWWCKPLGHAHPVLQQALKQQLAQFEHVMFANTTFENIILLSEKLAQLTTSLDKVFYASDGSCAVEIAMKMSLHARQIQGQTKRVRFMALENSYHGETALTMSVSDLGIYKAPYAAVLTDAFFLRGIPYVSSTNDPVWQDCSTYWPALLQQLEAHAEELTAILVEPIVQGAAGMKIYSQDFLKRLRAWTASKGIHLIADEIMTGLGRTGMPLACQHAQIEPDFLCLAKALTGGCLPLSATLTSSAIYQLFYDDYAKGKSFLHSHTHTGNALAVSVALACLQVLEQEQIYQKAKELESKLEQAMQTVADETGKLTNLRQLGAIAAADLLPQDKQSRIGFKVSQASIAHGALIRPIGNALYWLPPLILSDQELQALQEITATAVKRAYEG